MSETESLRIARLGSRGDGLAEDGTPVAATPVARACVGLLVRVPTHAPGASSGAR